MPAPRLVVLGGYGQVGRMLARVLLRETDAHVAIAGRNEASAQGVAAALHGEFPGGRVSAVAADAADRAGLTRALEGARMVLVTATAPEHVATVAEAALGAGCDYLDILLKKETLAALRPLGPKAAAAGRVFITQAGFHPGLPAPFLAQAAAALDRCERGTVTMAMSGHFEKPESALEIVDEVGLGGAEILERGAWRTADWHDAVTIDFGEPWNRRTCYPLHMEELRALPERLGLRDAGVYASGFSTFVDNVVFPLTVVAYRLRRGLGRRLWARMFRWGVNRATRLEWGVVFRAEVEGTKAGAPARVCLTARDSDTVHFTAAPVVSCVQQMLDGRIPAGLALMGNAVDPARTLRDLERMGVRITAEPPAAAPTPPPAPAGAGS